MASCTEQVSACGSSAEVARLAPRSPDPHTAIDDDVDAPVWEKAKARLEALLAESPQWAGGKQRLTAARLHRARLHRMLLAEGITRSPGASRHRDRRQGQELSQR
jgi:hypothetical protein